MYNLSRIYNIASHKNKTETRKHFFCCRGLKNRFFHDSMIMNICSCTAISNVKGSSNFDAKNNQTTMNNENGMTLSHYMKQFIIFSVCPLISLSPKCIKSDMKKI